jgi:integrase/recombinase XerD
MIRMSSLTSGNGYTRSPDMLAACQQVTAIPTKRSAPAETRFLERDEVEDLLRHMPRDGRHALRDRALILFLYNTGCRATEAADLRAGNLDLGEQPIARLHGKGDKWRTCPLWRQAADLLTALAGPDAGPGDAVFARSTGWPSRSLPGSPGPTREPGRRSRR